MTPKKIAALRASLGENTATFGARLLVSGRTVEDWEQGRRRPSALAGRELDRIAARVERRAEGGR